MRRRRSTTQVLAELKSRPQDDALDHPSSSFRRPRGSAAVRDRRFYGLASLDEARAYLAHPVLGARLRECTDLALSHGDVPIEQILGGVDAMKFLSCMQIFGDACGSGLAAAMMPCSRRENALGSR